MTNSKYRTYDDKIFFCLYSSIRPGLRHIFWYMYGISDNTVVKFNLRNTQYKRIYLNLTRNAYMLLGSDSLIRTQIHRQVSYINI